MTDTPTTALAPKKRDPLVVLVEEGIKPRIAAFIPPKTVERLARILLVEAQRNPAIRECSPRSIILAAMVVAQLDLEPGGLQGEAYFVPRNVKDKEGNWAGKELTVQVGYKGYIRLARRSKELAAIDAAVVFKGERFEVRRGTDPGVIHDWDPDVKRTAENVVAAYAVARLTNGEIVFEVLTRSEIDDRKSRSESVRRGRSSPWDSDYPAMARKSAIRALATSGKLPLTRESLLAAKMDEEATDGEREEVYAALAADTDIPPESGPAPAALTDKTPTSRDTARGRRVVNVLDTPASPPPAATTPQEPTTDTSPLGDGVPASKIESQPAPTVQPTPPVADPAELARMRKAEADRKKAKDDIANMEPKVPQDVQDRLRKARGISPGLTISASKSSNAALAAYADDLDRWITGQEAPEYTDEPEEVES